MPPKKTGRKPSRRDQKEAKNTENFKEEQQTQEQDSEQDNTSTGQKRKYSPSAPSSPPSKAAKTSPSLRNENDNTSELIAFLLSPAGLELCLNPTSQPKTIAEPNQALRDYFSPNLTPFEHLICAVILSRPISHNLGQRTIATVLNESWNWSNAQKVLDAGKENEEGKRNV